mmetsp:Transcript_94065/g.263286  ORF Transcript_94065/g.263286 Transcript_94065/m.263286 type:complete len:90 (+) Transcript_94065:61-330(+)
MNRFIQQFPMILYQYLGRRRPQMISNTRFHLGSINVIANTQLLFIDPPSNGEYLVVFQIHQMPSIVVIMCILFRLLLLLLLLLLRIVII